MTQDVDVCHARDADNLARVADALREVHAKLRGADPGVPFRVDARTLAMGDAFDDPMRWAYFRPESTSSPPPSWPDGHDDLA